MRGFLFAVIFLCLSNVAGLAQQNDLLSISSTEGTNTFQPLEEIRIESVQKGSITVLDGKGTPYFQSEIDRELRFTTGGALGNQTILLQNQNGALLDWINFTLEGNTIIKDESGQYQALLNTLYYSMIGEWGREAQIIRYDGDFYHIFVSWLRDHVHTLKGMQYFYPKLHSGIDLYARTQREDGMIWDNVSKRNQEKNWWDKRFRYGDFIRDEDNGLLEFKRIPIENDVEYLFIEGLYYTWKATGDDAWMKAQLDEAVKAVEYATSNPYRWSQKHQLLKRGFTIDTWDFQSNEDAALVGGDIMVVDLDKSRFGIMFGDNTGMAAGCSYLAEMLRYSNQAKKAAEIAQLGEQLQQRIDQLAWNGSFYTHHIPEDPNLKRDLGIDLTQQVSLSNAYSLNRKLSHEQCVGIIKTYQNIKSNIPDDSPGEWYTIYPPFPFGFGQNDSSSDWEYMNGGVTSIVAGELAHGAFEHGYESYGVDILNRIAQLAQKTNNFLHAVYRGDMPESPQREFQVVDLSQLANVAYPGVNATYDGARIDAGSVSGKKHFNDIPFQILDPQSPAKNCLQLSRHSPEATLSINQKAAAIYLLHTSSPGLYTGHIELHFEDGSFHRDYITMDKIGNWWIENEKRNKNIVCKKAWRSNNDQYVAFYTYGLNNPFPDKLIKDIHFVGTTDGRQWNIKGVTLSDYHVYYEPDIVSHGIPDNWGAAAVTYALVEGLVGVKNKGGGFEEVLVAPRWPAANTNSARATIHLPASDGYVSYNYQFIPENKTIELQVTGNASVQEFSILLPNDHQAEKLLKSEKAHLFTLKKVENSTYLHFEDQGVGVKQFEIILNSK